MTAVYLSDNRRFLEVMRAEKLAAYPLTSETLPDLRHGEVVVIGAPGKAQEAALALKARGVADYRLKYVEAVHADILTTLIKRPKHLYWTDARPLSEAPDEANFEVYDSGFPFLDPNLKWRASELAVMAGAYGSGKSTLAQLLATRFIAVHGKKTGWTALMCSWEDLASEMRRNAEAHAHFHKVEPKWLTNALHYVCRPPSEDRLIAWYMDLVRYYVSAFNTRFFVLDPWSEFDHVKPASQSETDYVRDMMKEFRRLVDELQIILLVATRSGEICRWRWHGRGVSNRPCPRLKPIRKQGGSRFLCSPHPRFRRRSHDPALRQDQDRAPHGPQGHRGPCLRSRKSHAYARSDCDG